MGAKENKQMVMELYKGIEKIFGGQDPDVAKFLAEDIEWWLPKSLGKMGIEHCTKGRDAVLKTLAGASKTYVPDSIDFNFWLYEGILE